MQKVLLIFLSWNSISFLFQIFPIQKRFGNSGTVNISQKFLQNWIQASLIKRRLRVSQKLTGNLNMHDRCCSPTKHLTIVEPKSRQSTFLNYIIFFNQSLVVLYDSDMLGRVVPDAGNTSSDWPVGLGEWNLSNLIFAGPINVSISKCRTEKQKTNIKSLQNCKKSGRNTA